MVFGTVLYSSCGLQLVYTCWKRNLFDYSFEEMILLKDKLYEKLVCRKLARKIACLPLVGKMQASEALVFPVLDKVRFSMVLITYASNEGWNWQWRGHQGVSGSSPVIPVTSCISLLCRTQESPAWVRSMDHLTGWPAGPQGCTMGGCSLLWDSFADRVFLNSHPCQLH